MAEEKKITVYVENKGRGKATIVDSNISVQAFPARNSEGKQTVRLLATKVEMPESRLKAFKGMAEVHYPHQLKILSEDDYIAIKEGKEPQETQEKKPDPEAEEIAMYEAAMKGGQTEILAYFNRYPEMTGAHSEVVQHRAAFLDVMQKNTKKDYDDFLKKFSKSPYQNEIRNAMKKAK